MSFCFLLLPFYYFINFSSSIFCAFPFDVEAAAFLICFKLHISFFALVALRSVHRPDISDLYGDVSTNSVDHASCEGSVGEDEV